METRLSIIQSVLTNAEMLDIKGVSEGARMLIADKIEKCIEALESYQRQVVELTKVSCEEVYNEEV